MRAELATSVTAEPMHASPRESILRMSITDSSTVSVSTSRVVHLPTKRVETLIPVALDIPHRSWLKTSGGTRVRSSSDEMNTLLNFCLIHAHGHRQGENVHAEFRL